MLGIDEENGLAGREKDRETAAYRCLVAAVGVERWRQRCKDRAGVVVKSPDVVSYRVVEECVGGATIRRSRSSSMPSTKGPMKQ